VMVIDDCTLFEEQKAEIEYELVDGKLRPGAMKGKSKAVPGLNLKGDWTKDDK
jgi:hypothetical protein